MYRMLPFEIKYLLDHFNKYSTKYNWIILKLGSKTLLSQTKQASSNFEYWHLVNTGLVEFQVIDSNYILALLLYVYLDESIIPVTLQ